MPSHLFAHESLIFPLKPTLYLFYEVSSNNLTYLFPKQILTHVFSKAIGFKFL